MVPRLDKRGSLAERLQQRLEALSVASIGTLPGWLGKLHPKYTTPYAALIVHAAVSPVLVLLNVARGGATAGASAGRLEQEDADCFTGASKRPSLSA